jgi:hypothetical protein
LAVEIGFMRKARLALIAFAFASSAVPALGQELQVPTPAPGREAVATPVRGTSMAQVEARFGAPTQRYAAVGQPPIARWVYPSFVVFFEYSHVVHAVAVAPPAGTP